MLSTLFSDLIKSILAKLSMQKGFKCGTNGMTHREEKLKKMLVCVSHSIAPIDLWVTSYGYDFLFTSVLDFYVGIWLEFFLSKREKNLYGHFICSKNLISW